MKVLLVHNNYTVQGGAEVFFHEIARVLLIHGHEVAFLSAADEADRDTEWKAYFPASRNYRTGSLLKRIMSFPGMIYSRGAKAAMSRIIEDFNPDIVHAFATYVKLTPSVLDACRESDVPVVVSFNDYKHICPSYKLFHHGKICEDCKGGRFYKAIVNRCSHDSLIYSTASSVEAYVHDVLDIYRKNVHTFLFSSDFMAHKTEEFWSSQSFRWRKLRNPFDSTNYQASFKPDGPVLFFGRLIEEKGVDILIRAAGRLPHVSFRIVGDGPDLNFLKQLVVDLDLDNVTLAGAMWGEEMDDEIRDCSFVVVPSVWHENFPYVINQSFAFGKLVVGSNRGGITELVEHGERGLIYEATDPDALANTILELWTNPVQIEEMGRRAKQYSDSEFNDEELYRTLNKIYTEVLS